MLLDGLTQERSPEDYFTFLHAKQVQLLVLNIKNARQAELMAEIENLWAASRAQFEVLDAEDTGNLPTRMATLLTGYLRGVVAAAQTRPADMPRCVPR
jgi:hypothetical protein